jgi:phytoene dehydrogenase-like protein
VVERLAHPGGRFTAKTFQGAQVSTGAVHMLPFGSNGELAAMLRALVIPHRIHDSEVFASFHVRGRQYVCRSVLQLAGVLGPRQFAQYARLGYEMLLRTPAAEECESPFRAWLDQRVSASASPELYRFFERICHFTLSVDLDDVSYAEIVETTKNMFRYGAPGIVDGGCAALTCELERRVLDGGGELRLQHDVLAIEHEGGIARGVRVRDRRMGEEMLLRAPLVVSNIGPNATERLIAPAEAAVSATHPAGAAGAIGHGSGARGGIETANANMPDVAHESSGRREASGLKVHLLSDMSVIPHRGIMYCLDTERIAGVVQPSNSDRRLAPPAKHLLITHQLLRSDDMNAEREAARADLHRLFGDDFGSRVTILTMSQYRGEWPVNRAVQGEDVSPHSPLAGLYLVGDAVKPSGYLMVEGVAQSVNALLDILDDRDGIGAMAARAVESGATRHTPPKPSKRRAWRWLVAPPPHHAGS